VGALRMRLDSGLVLVSAGETLVGKFWVGCRAGRYYAEARREKGVEGLKRNEGAQGGQLV
jgi:hypothetical protein